MVRGDNFVDMEASERMKQRRRKRRKEGQVEVEENCVFQRKDKITGRKTTL